MQNGANNIENNEGDGGVGKREMAFETSWPPRAESGGNRSDLIINSLCQKYKRRRQWPK